MKQKETELHIHILQSLFPKDLFFLAKDVYQNINWNRFNFLDRYEKVYGIRLDPVAIFDRAVKSGSLAEIEEINNYPFKGKGNFLEFDVKSYFPICITGYYFDNNDPYPILKMITERHKQEGLKYVEYRMGFGGSGVEWKKWHADFARFLKNASTEQFTAKYIVRLGSYKELKEMLLENPDLKDTIVGVDFSGKELDPEKYRSLFETIVNDNLVDIVIHIGENFLDKSLETAIRWCHQAALLGAKRLAHCIALGIDPLIAINRSDGAHLKETVEMRMDQIKYDLKYANELKAYQIDINHEKLNLELSELQKLDPSDMITRPYDKCRLEEISRRQDFVLDELYKMNKVIEVCPTSNLCIGGVPTISDHSFKKLYSSKVHLAICTDDPGIFNVTLADEVDFVMKAFNISKEDLEKRLDDPYKYRLRSTK